MIIWEELDSDTDDLDREMDRLTNSGQLLKGGPDVSDSDQETESEPVPRRIIRTSRKCRRQSTGATFRRTTI
jgi:hypothetical protein